MTRHVRIAVRTRVALIGAVAVGCTLMAVEGLIATDGSACPAEAMEISPLQSIQAAVERSDEDTAFCIKSGIYREQVIRPKAGQRFYGESGAILNGSRLLVGFARQGRYWIATWPGPYEARLGQCLEQEPACNIPEGVFVDGRAFSAASTRDELVSGQFFLNPLEGLIYLVDDPEGRTVEVASTPAAFVATAPHVLISNLIIEKYASPAQAGAIQVQTPAGIGWTIRNCEVRLNSAAAIAVGDGTHVQSCSIHHNGQIGITGVGVGVVIDGSEVWANNTRGFQFRWEAGGIKLAESRQVIFRDNRVHDNVGPGIWCDINCEQTLFDDNVVEHNSGPGIFYEISSHSLLQRNRLVHNGIDGKAWFWGVNILIAASEHVEIRNNWIVVAAGGCGIVLTDQGRAFEGSRGSVGEYKTQHDTIHDNDMTFEGAGCAGAASDVAADDDNYSVIETGNNVFARNVYRFPRTIGDIRFEWGHGVLHWNALPAKGIERDGQLVLY